MFREDWAIMEFLPPYFKPGKMRADYFCQGKPVKKTITFNDLFMKCPQSRCDVTLVVKVVVSFFVFVFHWFCFGFSLVQENTKPGMFKDMSYFRAYETIGSQKSGESDCDDSSSITSTEEIPKRSSPRRASATSKTPPPRRARATPKRSPPRRASATSKTSPPRRPRATPKRSPPRRPRATPKRSPPAAVDDDPIAEYKEDSSKELEFALVEYNVTLYPGQEVMEWDPNVRNP